ncbi:MAG: signal peptidase I [Deltaproteobacteria bacterium]|nr:signal peptidase I [Candidatus Zymogenaceae bacterium]
MIERGHRFFFAFCLFCGFLFLLFVWLFENIYVTASGMEPAVSPGDYLLVLSPGGRCFLPAAPVLCDVSTLRKNDLIYVRTPDEDRRRVILRVVGCAGDEVMIVDKTLFINGVPQEEPYVTFDDPEIYPRDLSVRDNFGPVVVPDGAVFALADHRDSMGDGRFFGFIGDEHLRGRVLLCYWSRDLTGRFYSVRWERVGKSF